MKNMTPIAIGVFLLLVVGFLIFYFKPANSQDSVLTTKQQHSSNTVSNSKSTDPLKADTADSNSTKNNTSIDKSDGYASEQQGNIVDFNKKVYGYGAESTDNTRANRKSEKAKSTDNLYNPQSDLNIKPIDPAKDPGNQVASFDER